MKIVSSKEYIYPCPDCSFPVSSKLSVCEKCGLELEPDGADYYILTEESKMEAVKDAVMLKRIAVLFAVISAGINFVPTKNRFLASMIASLWGLFLGMFLLKLGAWHYDYSRGFFDPDKLDGLKKERKIAVFIFFFALAYVAFYISRNVV